MTLRKDCAPAFPTVPTPATVTAAHTSRLGSPAGAPRLTRMAAAIFGLALGSAALGVSPSSSWAQAAPGASATEQKRSVNIPAGTLDQVLNRYAGAAGVELSIDAALTRDKTSPGLSGQYGVAEGFAELLRGQGLQAVRAANGTYTLRRAESATLPEGTKESTLPEVSVSAKGDTALPPTYPGGQVARGERLGLLGATDVFDTPFNVTTYTQKLIQDQQARSVADVVQNDPSVRMVSPQSNGSEVFNIRGFAVNNQDIAFDGLYGILPYWRGSVASAERVEILKGPSALLNGMAPSGAIGGAINVVPKRAGDTPLTQVTASYISDSNIGGQFDVGRRFGADNSIGLRVNGVYKNGDPNRTSQENGETTVALDYRGERTRLFADLGYQRFKLDKVEGLISLAAGASVPSPPSADKTYFQSWTTWKNNTTYGVLRGEFDLTPDLTAYAAIGARDFRDSYLFPYGFGLTNAGNFTEGFAYAASWYKTTSSDMGLRGRLTTGAVRHQFSLSVTDFHQEAGVLSGTVATNASNIYNPSVISQPSLAALNNIGKTADTRLSGLALADTLNFLDERVLLTLGLRQQQVKVDSLNGTTGALTAHYDKQALTPAVGLVLKPWQHVSLYGNYIEGLSQGPVAAAPAVNVGQVFAPYISKQYEAGVKGEVGSFAATASLFQITKPSGLLDPVTNVYGVNGEQRNRGLELNVFGQVSRGVRLLGGAMWLDARQTKTSGGTLDGRLAVNSPRIQLNLGGEWDTPGLAGFTLTGRVVYTGAAYVDAANTQQIPAWTRFDGGARYAFNSNGIPVTLRANIENLFNRTYWMSSSLYRGNPRTLMLSATMNF